MDKDMITVEQLQVHDNSLRAYAVRTMKDYHLAQDMVQETYFRAIRSQDSFDGGNLGGWLMTILKNVCVNYFRYTNTRPAIADATPDTLLEWGLSEPASYDSYNLGGVFENEDLDRAYQLLPDYQKQVIFLSNKVGMDDQAIADTLGIALATVRTRRGRAMKELRELMTA